MCEQTMYLKNVVIEMLKIFQAVIPYDTTFFKQEEILQNESILKDKSDNLVFDLKEEITTLQLENIKLKSVPENETSRRIL